MLLCFPIVSAGLLSQGRGSPTWARVPAVCGSVLGAEAQLVFCIRISDLRSQSDPRFE